MRVEVTLHLKHIPFDLLPVVHLEHLLSPRLYLSAQQAFVLVSLVKVGRKQELKAYVSKCELLPGFYAPILLVSFLFLV
jgi:hypothetical protein